MSDNIFLFDDAEDKERVEDLKTAELFDKAVITDIGKAVAYTDGDRIFVNTNENLYGLLPHYDEYKMLKWLLWHEEFHRELHHHERFHEFLIKHTPVNLAQQEVNIIMDILVHDSLCKMFPELIETARANCAQLRNCNSLHYPFKARDLMAMLEEYSEYKKEQEEKGTPSGGDSDTSEDKDETSDDETTDDETPMNIDDVPDDGSTDDDNSGGGEPSIPTKLKVDPTPDIEKPASNDKSKEPENKTEIEEPDWSILDDIDEEEFIDKWKGSQIVHQAERLKLKRINMGKITRQLASLSTTTKERTYRRPSRRQSLYGNVLAKGKIYSQASLYLIFDASGSMCNEMEMFKEIISISVPGAMNAPTEWFAGYGADAKTKNLNPESETLKKLVLSKHERAYKGIFKDFMQVQAHNGTGNDGDNIIELCYAAEQKGFTPIAVSDLQCSNLSYKDTSPTWDILAKLRRTIIVGPGDESTLEKIKEHNSHIQVFMV